MFLRDIGIAAAIGVGCFVVVALRVPDWYVFPVAILAIGLAVAARAVEAGAVDWRKHGRPPRGPP